MRLLYKLGLIRESELKLNISQEEYKTWLSETVDFTKPSYLKTFALSNRFLYEGKVIDKHTIRINKPRLFFQPFNGFLISCTISSSFEENGKAVIKMKSSFAGILFAFIFLLLIISGVIVISKTRIHLITQNHENILLLTFKLLMINVALASIPLAINLYSTIKNIREVKHLIITGNSNSKE